MKTGQKHVDSVPLYKSWVSEKQSKFLLSWSWYILVLLFGATFKTKIKITFVFVCGILTA